MVLEGHRDIGHGCENDTSMFQVDQAGMVSERLGTKNLIQLLTVKLYVNVLPGGISH